MYKVKETVLFVFGVIITLISSPSTHAQSSYTVGTGGVSGVYYPVGGEIAKIVNDSNADLQLVVESTGGSVFNIDAITSKQLDLAIAQSDVVYQTFFSSEASLEEKKLRSIMGLYPEPLHLVCNSESGVNGFQDIKGKRINIGNPGSGQLNIVRDLLKVYGMEESDFDAQYLEASQAADSLRTGLSDCFFYAVGIGSTLIQDVSKTLDVKVVSLKDPVLDELIEKFPYYTYATLPAGTYAGQDSELILFGVKALLVASTNLSDDDVYEIVKSIIDKFDQFKKTHAALENLILQESLEGLGAPLHPGAIRAYEEAGFSVELNDDLELNDDFEPEGEAERGDE